MQTNEAPDFLGLHKNRNYAFPLTSNRSNHWRLSIKKGVLRNFVNFTAKHSNWSNYNESKSVIICLRIKG